MSVVWSENLAWEYGGLKTGLRGKDLVNTETWELWL